MHGFKGERVLMRIHLWEQDRYRGKTLYVQLLELLRERGYAGATVFRGLMGFGAGRQPHGVFSDYLLGDLPIVVECVETEERIRAILPELDGMIAGGLITLERARVILYRPHRPEEETPDDWSIDLAGDWQPPPEERAP